MKIDFIRKIEGLTVRLLPDSFTGKSSVLEKELHTRFGSENLNERISEIKCKNAGRYIVVFLIVMLLVLGIIITNADKLHPLNQIDRPDNGESALKIPVLIQTEQNGSSLEEESTLTVRPKALSEAEEKEILADYLDGIEEIITKENSSLDAVTSDLNLITSDPDTNIMLRWESDNPDVVSEEGKVNVSRITDGSITVYLNVFGTLGGSSSSREVQLTVLREGGDYDGGIKEQMKDLTGEISSGEDGTVVVLPGELETGEKIVWKRNDRSDPAGVVIFGLIAFAIIYLSSLSRTKKNTGTYLKEIRDEFPAFIDKLVLLLNAGMVPITALDKIALDYVKGNGGKQQALYEEIVQIQVEARETNKSILYGWKKFGRRIEISEVMRFCTILEDNLNKGSSLSSKLESEAELMRRNRAKDKEEQARKAESKMTIPMLLSLVTLVLITIAPSMMEM